MFRAIRQYRKLTKSSKYRDIEESYNNVLNIERKEGYQNVLRAICSMAFVAHFVSIVGLYQLLFGGDRSFKPEKFIHWSALGVLIALLIHGLIEVWKKMKNTDSYLVNYSQLHDLLTVARYEAENSIINIGGDLSW